MAKCNLNGLIGRIGGSLGDVTFSYWRKITLIRKRVTKMRNPNTKPQKRVRQMFARFVREWANMRFIERALWEEYAKRINKIKTTRRCGLVPVIGGLVNGKNAYISVNQLLMGCGFQTINIPNLATGDNPPSPSTDLINYGEHRNEIRFKLWLNREYEYKCVCQVWVKKIEDRSYPYIRTVVPISTKPTIVIVNKIRSRKGKTIVEKNLIDINKGKLLLQMRTVAQNGKVSHPTTIYKLEINHD